MCLEVSVVISASVKRGIGAERLQEVSGLHVKKHGNRLHFSRTGGCSCDLMAKGIAQKGSSWLLADDAAAKLADTVAFIGKEAKSFSFQIVWLGETLEAPVRMKLNTLVTSVRNNTVPKNTPIIVGSFDF